jgi:hypothetical protein
MVSMFLMPLACDQLVDMSAVSSSLAVAQHFAGVGVDHVARQDLADQVFRGTSAS